MKIKIFCEFTFLYKKMCTENNVKVIKKNDGCAGVHTLDKVWPSYFSHLVVAPLNPH